jgi:7-keto-8-aminopelargonate synthetase-like enzyme
MSEPAPLPPAGRTTVRWRGRTLDFFAGCDYFRLSSHPQIVKAVSAGLRQFGLNIAASRVTTGNHALYLELETALARFFGAPAAVCVTSGYATNLIVAQALRGEVAHVFIDDKAHVSLQDAGLMFGCGVTRFRHGDAVALKRGRAGWRGAGRVIVLTDGVYTYEGQTAPLRQYLEVIRGGDLLLVDDAHGAGWLGRHGRGTPEWEGIPRARVIQTVTLSKAFGAYGGAVIGTVELREKIFARSGMFAGSTPMPLPLAWAALCAVKLLHRDRTLKHRLDKNTRYLKDALRRLGYAVADSVVPVVAITPKHAAEAKGLKRRLLAHGIFPSFIQYPGGPEGGYLRLVVSSEHTQKQLAKLVAAVGGAREIK